MLQPGAMFVPLVSPTLADGPSELSSGCDYALGRAVRATDLSSAGGRLVTGCNVDSGINQHRSTQPIVLQSRPHQAHTVDINPMHCAYRGETYPGYPTK